MISMTDAERKLYRRKMNESIEAYIRRLEETAQLEQKFPADWWRHLARVLQVIAAPLDQMERDIISRSCKTGKAVAETEVAIIRYRRLTGRHQPDINQE